jgi:peptidoglycan hydrolase CwlO-like protein
MQPLVPSLVNFFGGGIRPRRDHSEERRENERQELLTQIRSAPNPAASVDTNTALPTSSERRASYTRRPTAKPSPPLSPIELPGFNSERHDWQSESISNHNVPPSPESPPVARASTAPIHTEDLSTHPPIKEQAIQHLQAQLDDVRVEIEGIKQQRDDGDRQIAKLTKLVNEATQENSKMSVDLSELRARLREAREEERRLNDEINEMRNREKKLMDDLHEAQMARHDSAFLRQVSPTRSNSGQSKKSSHTHRRKSSSKEEKELVYSRPRSSRRSWKLP